MADGQHPQLGIQNEQRPAHGFHNGLGQAAAGLELGFEGLEGRDVGEGDNRPADVVVEGAVGQNAHGVPLAGCGLNIGFHAHEAVEHLAHVLGQVFVAQGAGKVRNGPAHVGRQQRDNAMHGRRKPLYHHVVVEENGGNFRGIEQVLHVVGRQAQLLGFAEVLHIQSHQLLVQALHFLLVGHGLLVGALQLLVGALQLLVGALELFHAAFHLLDGGLEAVLGELQLIFEGHHRAIAPIGGRGRRGLAQAHLARGGPVLKHHQQQVGQGLGVGQGLHREAQQLEAGLGFEAHAVGHGELAGGQGLAHGPAYFIAQLFAGHVEEVHAAQAGGGLQVAAGAAVHVQNIALGVDNHGGRGVLAQQQPLHQRGKRTVFGAGPQTHNTCGRGRVGLLRGQRKRKVNNAAEGGRPVGPARELPLHIQRHK